MALFLIRDCFVWSSRQVLCFMGDIIEGEIEQGMTIVTRDVLLGDLIINSVESVRGISGDVGLVIKYEELKNEVNWRNLKNQTVLIVR